MAQQLPDYDSMLIVANSYIESTVDEIIERKVKEAQEEIAHKLPQLAGKVSARIMQECMKMGSIQPQISVNITTIKENKA